MRAFALLPVLLALALFAPADDRRAFDAGPATRPAAPETTTACPMGPFSAQNPPPACWRPYSDQSPFNRPLPAAPRLATDSAKTVARWTSLWSGGSSPRFGVGTADTKNDYEHPLYYSRSSDPEYTVRCMERWGTCEVEGMKVRIPAGARPAGGGDGHLAVIDTASGWEYDFWQVRSKPASGGVLEVSWGGRTRIDGDGRGSEATAGHFGLAAGIVRPAELAAREINHALFMVVKCTNGTSVYPAGSGAGRPCSQIGLPNADAPPMGAHFFLDMSSAEIDALPIATWKKTMLRAMARYGLIVGDTGGGFIKLESGSSFTSFGQADPWVQVAKDAGIPAWAAFDPARLVDPARWRVAAPCVSLPQGCAEGG